MFADYFHWFRYACDALNKIRIDVQNNLPKNERKYFKHSRKLLLSRHQNIKNENSLDELSYILTNYSENLRIAYREKEYLLDIFIDSLLSILQLHIFQLFSIQYYIS